MADPASEFQTAKRKAVAGCCNNTLGVQDHYYALLSKVFFGKVLMPDSRYVMQMDKTIPGIRYKL